MDKLIWYGGMKGSAIVLTKGLPGYVWQTANGPVVTKDVGDIWLMSPAAEAAAIAASMMKGASQ